VIGGVLTPKASPSGEHGGAQAAIAGTLFGPFNRRGGGAHPGGGWFETAVELELEPFFIDTQKAPQGVMITKKGKMANVFLYEANTLLYDREWTILRKGDTVRLCTLSYDFLMEFTVKLA
jgi:hypothetical protein